VAAGSAFFFAAKAESATPIVVQNKSDRFYHGRALHKALK
jgi:hypothetical protein